MRLNSRTALLLIGLIGTTALAGCNDAGRLPRNSRHYVPMSAELVALMSDKGMSKQSPILLRAFKKESELEVWKIGKSGKYELLSTYPMCRWSGQLGPKKKEGDRQVPEGFYAISANQLNPNSNYYLSFNIGYPNQYDRTFGRTGSLIMVHGACSSAGCFSMTDAQIADIYALTREAFAGGQQAVQMQSLPFRMTPENLAKFRADENMPFWRNLKEGAEHFDVSRLAPQVAVCGKRYLFNAAPKNGARFDAAAVCPPVERDESLVAAVDAKRRADDLKVAELVNQGVRAVKRIYKDGDQHPSFKATAVASIPQGDRDEPLQVASAASRVADVSRPEAIEQGPVEVPVDELAGGKARLAEARARLASAEPAVTGAIATPRPATGALLGPSPAAPATPAVAKADVAPALPATSAAFVASEAKSEGFLRSWFGIGGESKPAPAESEPQLVNVPLPPPAPRRPQLVSTKIDRTAALPLDALPRAITGGAPILPAGLTAFVAIER